MVVKKMAGTPVPPVSVFTGASTLSGAVYEGNQKHFDLSFLKISIFLTKSVHKLQCNHECNTVMNK
jgi:hypothetical protein